MVEAAPPSNVLVSLKPLSGNTVEFRIEILLTPPPAAGEEQERAAPAAQPERAKIQLAPRSKPVVANRWEERDMGAGGEQWGGLNVDAKRKKKRCAECTRPLPESCTSLLCGRCSGTDTSPPGAVASAGPASVKASPLVTAKSPSAGPGWAAGPPPGLILPPTSTPVADAAADGASKVRRPRLGGAPDGHRLGGVEGQTTRVHGAVGPPPSARSHQRPPFPACLSRLSRARRRWRTGRRSLRRTKSPPRARRPRRRRTRRSSSSASRHLSPPPHGPRMKKGARGEGGRGSIAAQLLASARTPLGPGQPPRAPPLPRRAPRPLFWRPRDL